MVPGHNSMGIGPVLNKPNNSGLPPNANVHPMKVLFIIPKNEPPKLSNEFSTEFRQFMQCCLAMKPNHRKSAAELQAHPFLRLARGCSYLKSSIIQIEKEVTGNEKKYVEWCLLV